MFNATYERRNNSARKWRMNSATGWYAQQEEAFIYVSVNLGSVHRVEAILVKDWTCRLCWPPPTANARR